LAFAQAWLNACGNKKAISRYIFKGGIEMDTTASAAIKVLNKPNKMGSIMKNLARFIIRVLLTGLENVGTAEAYCLGIDIREQRKKEE
jgi:hypothetical protein